MRFSLVTEILFLITVRFDSVDSGGGVVIPIWLLFRNQVDLYPILIDVVRTSPRAYKDLSGITGSPLHSAARPRSLMSSS